ncbi:MAG TPA: FAD-dependent oxidoreductase [Thermomicrobiales bacterium]|nr:FAD-dependent oxidoreductase [Thermomicrobiales bacterium]
MGAGDARTIVIVGANMAGGRAAETLRQQGFAGRVVLVGAEPDRPYERPPLSKEYLQGERGEDFYLRPPDYYAEHDIELLLGARATRLDPAARAVELADGRRLTYDRLLIATGATPRRLPIPGADLDGVLYLRTLPEARALRERVAGAGRAVVVGMGFIGAEVVASCRKRGLEVTALELLPVPLERALGRQIGEIYAEIHRAHGVDLRLDTGVAEFRGDGRVEQVVTAAGERLDCDLAVVGVGVAPVVDWLAGSGLEMQNGVVVDEVCRTNLPDVYAAGDVANWWHPRLGERLRVEHYDNAMNQGIAAAKSMLGQGESYAPVPYFWSDQYDLRMQYVGHASGQDEVVLRGSPEDPAWSAWYLRDGRLRAALAVNRFKDISAARQLLARDIPVTRDQLADEGVDLRALARKAG